MNVARLIDFLNRKAEEGGSRVLVRQRLPSGGAAPVDAWPMPGSEVERAALSQRAADTIREEAATQVGAVTYEIAAETERGEPLGRVRWPAHGAEVAEVPSATATATATVDVMGKLLAELEHLRAQNRTLFDLLTKQAGEQTRDSREFVKMVLEQRKADMEELRELHTVVRKSTTNRESAEVARIEAQTRQLQAQAAAERETAEQGSRLDLQERGVSWLEAIVTGRGTVEPALQKFMKSLRAEQLSTIFQVLDEGQRAFVATVQESAFAQPDPAPAPSGPMVPPSAGGA